MASKPVRFEVGLRKGDEGHSVKSDLERLADDLVVDVYDFKNRKMQLVTGSTSQKTYEKIFRAELNYITRTIPNVNRGPYDVQEWTEIKPAVVPEHLKDRVVYIRLEQQIYLTD